MPQQVLTTNIRQLRLAADMTQEQLADKVGAVRQTIAYLEKGEYMPSLALAWRIASVFNKPLEEVFNLNTHGSH
ncbi:MAG TPA: helix-turn-helix transcriptional regulator [Verrucomicrobiae bacterium]|nr:helix-turn-helix transcriptional regulator [Verrucomicrobiae bacterium]